MSVRLSISDTDGVASGAKPKPKGRKCGDCASFVTEKECWVLYEICETWYYAKCGKVQDDTYEFLKRDEGFIGFVKIVIRAWLKCLRP